jgi:hypothetical protein
MSVEHIASFFRVEKEANQETSRSRQQAELEVLEEEHIGSIFCIEE